MCRRIRPSGSSFRRPVSGSWPATRPQRTSGKAPRSRRDLPRQGASSRLYGLPASGPGFQRAPVDPGASPAGCTLAPVSAHREPPQPQPGLRPGPTPFGPQAEPRASIPDRSSGPIFNFQSCPASPLHPGDSKGPEESTWTPRPCEAAVGAVWRAGQGSNLQPSAPETDALSIELPAPALSPQQERLSQTDRPARRPHSSTGPAGLTRLTRPQFACFTARRGTRLSRRAVKSERRRHDCRKVSSVTLPPPRRPSLEGARACRRSRRSARRVAAGRHCGSRPAGQTALPQRQGPSGNPARTCR